MAKWDCECVLLKHIVKKDAIESVSGFNENQN